MHNHITKIDKHPFADALSLDAQWPQPLLLGFHQHVVRKRFHVPTRGATCDHKIIHDRAQTTHVHDDRVQRLEVIQGKPCYPEQVVLI